MNNWEANLELFNYSPVDDWWECQVCGKRYRTEAECYRHAEENHQGVIKEVEPELEPHTIEEENRERKEEIERWAEQAEEWRLERYRKDNQCPCEKVIEGVKFAGFLGVLGLGMFITLADEGLKRGFDWIEKQIKEDKK